MYQCPNLTGNAEYNSAKRANTRNAVLPRQMNGSGALTEEKLVYALLSLFGLLPITCAYNKKAERAEEILDISYLPGLKIDST